MSDGFRRHIMLKIGWCIVWLTLAVTAFIVSAPLSVLGSTWGRVAKVLNEVFYIPGVIAFLWHLFPSAAVVIIVAVGLARMKDEEKETEKRRKMSSFLKVALLVLVACSVALFVKVFHIATLID